MTFLKLTAPIAIATTLLLTGCGNSGTDAATDAVKDTVKTAATKTSGELAAKFKDASIGNYSLDKGHAFLWFEVSHNGVSNYRANFTDMDVKLKFDPSHPDADHNSVSVTINPASIVSNYPGDYKAGHAKSPYNSWDEDLSQNPKFLNAGAFPKITFQSTSLNSTGEYTGKMTGDLTFLGVTKPITMDVTYNGTGNKPWFGERDLIGFNAETVLKRSDFGMDHLQKFVGDEVTVKFTGEFLQDAE